MVMRGPLPRATRPTGASPGGAFYDDPDEIRADARIEENRIRRRQEIARAVSEQEAADTVEDRAPSAPVPVR